MNADLYTLLLFLGGIGLFLAIVVGRLQFSDDDFFQRAVVDKQKAAKSLEDDYQTQSEVAQRLGANLERSDFLPIIGRTNSATSVGDLTPGHLFRQALTIYEAIEHVDDPDNADRYIERTAEEFGMAGSDVERADLKTMLRLARIAIHARANDEDADEFEKQLDTFIQSGSLSLSAGGKLRMREVLTFLCSKDMQSLVDEYRNFIPVVEKLLLSEPVPSKT
jgi:hypothetical protein